MLQEIRYAILIGNRYHPFDEHLVDLGAPERDVDGMADVLGNPQIGRFDDVRRLKTMSHRDILDEVQRVFLQAQKDDLVLFYFSGHGLFDEQGHLHLAVMNTQSSLLRVTSLPLETIKEMIDACRSVRIVLILDCCFSGIREPHIDLEVFAHYMQLVSSGRGKYIMTSSPHHYDPQEKNAGAYSPFTQHLIDGLQTGLADINREGTITVDHLYHYIYMQVASRLGHNEPMKWDLNGKGSCILAWTTPTSSLASTAVKVRYDAIAQLFKKGEIIPFLGPGVVEHGVSQGH
jgi:Caspase domain